MAIRASSRTPADHNQNAIKIGTMAVAAAASATGRNKNARSRPYNAIHSSRAGRYNPAFGFNTMAAPTQSPTPAAATFESDSLNLTAHQAPRPTQTTMNVSQTLRSRKPPYR